MDEISVINGQRYFLDSSGAGRNLQIMASTVSMQGDAASFTNGLNEYCAVSFGGMRTKEYTISCWVSMLPQTAVDTWNNYPRIWASGSDAIGYFHYTPAVGVMTFRGGNVANGTAISGQSDRDQWIHFVATMRQTYDETLGKERVENAFYRNGVRVDNGVLQDANDANGVTIGSIWFGGYAAAATSTPSDRRNFLGYMREARVYSRALSAEEIKTLYAVRAEARVESDFTVASERARIGASLETRNAASATDGVEVSGVWKLLSAPEGVAATPGTCAAWEKLPLKATVADADGGPGTLRAFWRVKSGAGARIDTPFGAETTASFTQAGTFVFECVATDGQDETAVTVTVEVSGEAIATVPLPAWQYKFPYRGDHRVYNTGSQTQGGNYIRTNPQDTRRYLFDEGIDGTAFRPLDPDSYVWAANNVGGALNLYTIPDRKFAFAMWVKPDVNVGDAWADEGALYTHKGVRLFYDRKNNRGVFHYIPSFGSGGTASHKWEFALPDNVVGHWSHFYVQHDMHKTNEPQQVVKFYCDGVACPLVAYSYDGAALTYEWSVAHGDAEKVAIATPDAAATQVTIARSGVYALSLRVSDGLRVVHSEVLEIDVQPGGMTIVVR